MGRKAEKCACACVCGHKPLNLSVLGPIFSSSSSLVSLTHFPLLSRPPLSARIPSLQLRINFSVSIWLAPSALLSSPLSTPFSHFFPATFLPKTLPHVSPRAPGPDCFFVFFSPGGRLVHLSLLLRLLLLPHRWRRGGGRGQLSAQVYSIRTLRLVFFVSDR